LEGEISLNLQKYFNLISASDGRSVALLRLTLVYTQSSSVCMYPWQH